MQACCFCFFSPDENETPDSFDSKGRKHGWCADVLADGNIVNERCEMRQKHLFMRDSQPISGFNYPIDVNLAHA